jgi:hypothetical protein
VRRSLPIKSRPTCALPLSTDEPTAARSPAPRSNPSRPLPPRPRPIRTPAWLALRRGGRYPPARPRAPPGQQQPRRREIRRGNHRRIAGNLGKHIGVNGDWRDTSREPWCERSGSRWDMVWPQVSVCQIRAQPCDTGSLDRARDFRIGRLENGCSVGQIASKHFLAFGNRVCG